MNRIIFVLGLLTLMSCVSNKETVKETDSSILSYRSKPQTIIYKTKQDYSNLVPIQMDDSKTKIVGFPAPSDLKKRGILQTPIQIKDGYCLDRRGLNKNSVFLNIDYVTYSRLNTPPSIEKMKASIQDKYPFDEMYVCPNMDEDTPIEELKKIVDSKFKNCTKIKL